MAAFCTITDIANFLQITIPAGSASATRAITEASAAIQNYCRQRLEGVDDDEITLDCNGGTKIFLPELPVIEVSEVVEDGIELTEITDYKLGQHGILHRISVSWKAGIQIVTVTYSHGYATLPDDIVSICLRAAARSYQAGLRAAEMAGVAGVQSKTLGDYQISYGSEQSGGTGEGGVLGASAAPILLPSERRILDRYRFKGA